MPKKANLAVSIEDILKIFQLLNNNEASNQRLAISLMEGFGIVADLLDDLIYQLVINPNSINQKILTSITLKIAQYYGNENGKVIQNKEDLLALNPIRTIDLKKIACRENGKYFYELMKDATLDDRLKLATFYLSKNKSGANLHTLPIDENILFQLNLKGLRELMPNPEFIENFPFEKAIAEDITVLNLCEFPTTKLTSSLLKQLKGRTLVIRRGFYFRNKKLLNCFPEVKITICDAIYYPIGHPRKDKKSRLEELDNYIYEGQMGMTAIFPRKCHFFPIELENFEDLEVVFLHDSNLKTIPYRLFRLRKLKYLIISSAKSTIKIKKALSNHPNLEAILFYQFPLENFAGKIKRLIPERIGYLPKKAIQELTGDRLNYWDCFLLPTSLHLMIEDLNNLLEEHLYRVQHRHEQKPYYTLGKCYYNKSFCLPNYLLEYPLPIFENVSFDFKILTDKELQEILRQIKT